MNYCFFAPILPGGEEKIKKWVEEGVKGNADHDRVMTEAGVTREQLWIQRTPMGNFAVASLETEDVGKSFMALATSTDPWAVRFSDLLMQVHGIDMKQPVPMNELITDWKASEPMKA